MKKLETWQGKKLYKMHDSQTLLLWSQIFTIEPRKVKENNILNFYIKIPAGDMDCLEKAFNKVIETNDALRLRIIRTGLLGLCQFIDDYRPVRLSRCKVASQAAFDADYLSTVYTHPLPLLGERLFWAELVDIGGEAIVLVMRFHHMIIDGYSIALIYSRVTEAYDQYRQGIEPLPKQYSIVRSFEQVEKYKASPKHAEDWAYWMKSFNKQPHYSMPAGRRSEFGACAEAELAADGQLYQDTIALASRLGCSLQSLVMTVAALTVYRLTGKTNFCIYSLTHGRFDALDKKTVGCLMNTVPTFFNLQLDHSFSQTLQDEYLNFLETLKHGRLSMSEQTPMSYKEAVLHGFNFNHAWLAISAMDYERAFAQSTYIGKALPGKNSPQQFYGSVLEIPGERIQFVLTYQTHRFKPAQVERILANYHDTLQLVVANPDAAVRTLRA